MGVAQGQVIGSQGITAHEYSPAPIAAVAQS